MSDRDRVEHARLVERPAARTRVQRINDNALEYLILASRAWSVATVLLTVVALGVAVWTVDWRPAVLAVLAAGNAAFCGWWGWWAMGNAEWRRG